MDLSNIIFTIPKYNDRFSAWIEHIPVAFFLTEILEPNVFVELGVHSGTSYFSFCQAFKQLDLKSKAFAIDHWQGDLYSGQYETDTYNYVTNINKENFLSFSSLLKMPFDDANIHFKDKSIDLLHIDGLHTYEAVKHDFETWLPKMSESGVVLLHDIQVKDTDFGVWRLMDELKNKYVTLELNYSYGLGIVCVGKKINKSLLKFIDEYKKEPFYESVFKNIGQSHLLSFYKTKNDLQNKNIINLEKELAASNRLKRQLNKTKLDNEYLSIQIQEYTNLPKKNNDKATPFHVTFIEKILDKANRFYTRITIGKKIRKSGLFDESYYKKNYSDVRYSDMNAMDHYIFHGGLEGRSPSEKFDGQFYLENNPDVKLSKTNPLIHYIKYGRKEERLPKKQEPIFMPPINDHCILLPFEYKIIPITPSPKIAVICHIFYVELTNEIAQYLKNIPYKFDLFITTDTNEKSIEIQKVFIEWKKGSVEIQTVINVGRDVSAKLLNWNMVYKTYEFVLHIHSKKSVKEPQLKEWRKYIFETLLGSKNIVESIFEAFKSDSKLGMIAPQHYQKIRHAIGWGLNFHSAFSIANKMGIQINSTSPIDFPSGSMFWARTNCLKPLLNSNIAISDFPSENGQTDNTTAHIIERLYFFICEKAGYKWIKVETDSEDIQLKRIINIKGSGPLKSIINDIQSPLLKHHKGRSVSIKNKAIIENRKLKNADKLFYKKVQKGSNYINIDLNEFIVQLQLHKEGKKCIIDFDEAFYLAANKDVAKMVSVGLIESGYVHFCLSGKKEKRVWSNNMLSNKFKINPHYPDGMFRPTHIKSRTVAINLSSEIKRSKNPYLLILLGHLQSDLFYAGYEAFFQDFQPVMDHFGKVDLAIESDDFEPDLAKKYSSKVNVYNQKKLEDIKCIPDVIICFNNQMYTKALKTFKTPDKIVYYCQDYEAGFFPFGTEYIEAEKAIANSKNIIVSTILLKQYFEHRNLVSDQRFFITKPKINRIEVIKKKTKKLFFYFRPEYFHTRNIPEILWEALEEFTKKHNGYEIYMIGSINTRFSIEINNTPVYVINKLPIEEYHKLLSTCDVVVAMIYSAHPGVIAFQSAASGIPTVTNTFENRDANHLNQISKNIVPYNPLKDKLLDKIEMALDLPKGVDSFNEELYSGPEESSTILDYINNIYQP